MNVTQNERLVLETIRDSEYQDGSFPAGHHVWTDYINPFAKRSTFSGVVSSLSQKGLVSVYQGSTRVQNRDGSGGADPSTIALTTAGCAVLGIKHNGQ